MVKPKEMGLSVELVLANCPQKVCILDWCLGLRCLQPVQAVRQELK